MSAARLFLSMPLLPLPVHMLRPPLIHLPMLAQTALPHFQSDRLHDSPPEAIAHSSPSDMVMQLLRTTLLLSWARLVSLLLQTMRKLLPAGFRLLSTSRLQSAHAATWATRPTSLTMSTKPPQTARPSRAASPSTSSSRETLLLTLARTAPTLLPPP